MADQPIDKMSFEEALTALEGVVEALEGGKVPLERSLDLYEQGERLRKHCEDRLKAAELRVEKIVAGSDGEAVGTVPLDEQQQGAATKTAAKPAAKDTAKGAAAQDGDIPF